MRLVALAAAGVGLVAGAGIAAAQEDDGDQPPEPSDEEREAHHAAFEAFRACMADHGVELPEHPVGHRVEGGGDAEAADPPDIDRDAAEAAFEACRDLMPLPPGVTQEELDAHDAAFDEYAGCMSEHGVEVEEHIPGLGPHDEGELSDDERAAAEAAFEQCGELVPPPPGITDEEFAQRQAQFEEFRACLSEHGVETPERGIPGVPGSHPEKAEPTDEQREQFEAAADACADLRPEGGPGPHPFGGHGGPGGPHLEERTEEPAEPAAA